MQPAHKLGLFLLDVELALDMASTGQYFDHMSHHVRIWKAMGYGEYAIRIILSRFFRFVDSPTEMCMRISMERLKIGSDQLQSFINQAGERRRFVPEDRRITRTRSAPNIRSYTNKLRGIQNHPLIVNGYINAKFTKIILDLVQAIFEKIGQMDSQNAFRLQRKNVHLESAFERSHAQLEKMVRHISKHTIEHTDGTQLRITIEDSPPHNPVRKRSGSF